MASSSPVWFSIPEWYGIQQQKDGRLLPIGTASDARNMETGDGNLSVAKGYTKHIESIVPGSGRILKLVTSRSTGGNTYVVTEDHIYSWHNGAWGSLCTFSPALTATQVDALQTRIGTTDVILVCTGDTRIVKIDTANNTAVGFGADLTSYTGTVSSYDANSLTVTLGSDMSDEAKRRALAYGVTIADVYYDVYEIVSGVSNELVLTAALLHTPTAGDSVTIRGGGSKAHVAFAELYANRLFTAGDPSATFRLYWSAVPGDGRTIEDWLSVDGSEDASGGYVEVGDGSADPIIGLTALSNQLIIWKRYSVWRLFGDRPSTFTLERVDSESDLMSNAGVITKYDAPYLLMPNGIYTYNGVSVVPVDNGVQQLRKFFEMNPDVSNSRCAFWNNRFYFSCKLHAGESTYDDTVIVFDVARNSYMLRDGFQVADISSVGSDIFMINGERYVYRFEYGDTYDDQPIQAYWQTQPMDFGKKMNKHQVMAMYMQLMGDGLKLTTYGDYMNDEKNVVSTELHAGYTVARMRTDQSYVFAFRFENIEGGAFQVLGGVNIKVLSEMKE